MEYIPTFLQITTRMLLAIVLLVAGLTKFSNLSYTEEVINNFRVLPRRITPVVKFLLPVVELLIGLSFLIPDTVGIASAFAALLFAAFIITLSIPLLQGRNVPCGCFGHAYQEKVSGLTIVRGGLFFIASILIYLNYPRFSVTWMSGGSFIFTFAGFFLTLSAILTSSGVDSSQFHAHENGLGEQPKQILLMSRRDALKTMIAILAAILLPDKRVSAADCCRCEYQHHYELRTSECCGGSTGNAYHRHHYWKRCKNICTGQRGNWHLISSDCSCECGTCSDYTWTVNQCCYAAECCCGYNCPCS